MKLALSLIIKNLTKILEELKESNRYNHTLIEDKLECEINNLKKISRIKNELEECNELYNLAKIINRRVPIK